MNQSRVLALIIVVPTLTLTDLILPIVPIVFPALGWSRAVVGVVALVGVWRMIPTVLSLLVPVLGFGRVREFVAWDGGFVYGVYVASTLGVELWPGGRGHVEGTGGVG
jgi:hypothetical protein